MKHTHIVATLLLVVSTTITADDVTDTPPALQQLLTGEVLAADDKALPFSLEGESRERPHGGKLTLGEMNFTIQNVSIHSMIGAKGEMKADEEGMRYAVFSSSYSEQTATGTPWVAAVTTHHCDEPYNAFLAIYTITDNDKNKALGQVAYPKLVDVKEAADDSVIYCFMAKPPAATPAS